MMAPIDGMMPMAPQMMVCCSLVGVVPWLILMVIPLIVVGAIVHLLAKQPETGANQEFSR